MSSHVPRLEVPYGFFHIGTRGNNRRSIFADDRDRESFLMILRRVARRYGWQLYAYCLMNNHYHLILQIADLGLSQGMCELNTAHAATYNVRHDRTNHLFGRRYWSELIDTDEYLATAARYVVQNPVRAGLTSTCGAWKWSSFRATVGSAPAPPFLAADRLLEIVEPGPESRRATRFREFCAHTVPKRPRSNSNIWRQPP
ncbi:MAG: REP-associated tyrosine transposase [Gaiellaceae bacterium]